MPKEITKTVVIGNKLGLHARPAAQLVKVASRFSSDIIFARGEEKVNAKSIMGVLMLAAPQGTSIQVIASGEDAAQAVREIESLVESKFGED